MNLSQYLEQQGSKEEAVTLLSEVLKTTNDVAIQARHLALLADVDFAAAEQMQ